MARTLEYLEQAVADAEGAARWYAERSPTAARRFNAELESAELAKMERPDAWGLAADGNRRYLLRRFPFSVVNRFHEAVILIVAVAHGRRRPSYWQRLSR